MHQGVPGFLLRAIADLVQIFAHEFQPGGVHEDFQSSRFFVEAEVLVQVPGALNGDAAYFHQPCCTKLRWEAYDGVPKVGLCRVVEAAFHHEVVDCICIGPALRPAVLLSDTVKAKPEAHGDVDSVVHNIDFQIC